MKRTPKLYNVLLNILKQVLWLDKRHMITFVWMVFALIQTRKINLSQWVPFIDARAKQAQSTERRLTRWLHNERIEPLSVYEPLIKEALANWGEEKLYIALDTSMIWNSYCQIRLCVIYRGRSIPLVWKTIKHKSSTVKLSCYKDLLVQAKEFLPENVGITFLADRGFVDIKLMTFLSQLGWHWRIRFKKGINIYRQARNSKKWCRVKVSAQHGHANFYHNVCITEEHFGTVHIAFARLSGSRESWCIVSDEPTNEETLKEYSLRFEIEEGFKDDKSGLFQLESSKLRDAAALTRLYLIVAVATLFLVSQGVEIVRLGLRRWVDPHWQRGLSYLKIGLRWVESASIKGYQLIKQLMLPSTPDPEPVCPSLDYKSPSSKCDEFKTACLMFPEITAT